MLKHFIYLTVSFNSTMYASKDAQLQLAENS